MASLSVIILWPEVSSAPPSEAGAEAGEALVALHRTKEDEGQTSLCLIMDMITEVLVFINDHQ